MQRLATLQQDASYQSLLPTSERAVIDVTLEQYKHDVNAEIHVATFTSKVEHVLSELQDIQAETASNDIRTHHDTFAMPAGLKYNRATTSFTKPISTNPIWKTYMATGNQPSKRFST